MNEMESREDGIDRLLQRSMTGPVPRLAPDFDERVMRELRRRSEPMGRSRRLLLAGYGTMSVAVSAIVMRGQGLGWGMTMGMILAPCVVIAVVRLAQRASQVGVRHNTI